jgi:hypothetical protein
MSIEEAAKRVLELAAKVSRGPWQLLPHTDYDDPVVCVASPPAVQAAHHDHEPIATCAQDQDDDSDATFIAEVRTLAPQLAQWVEKMLPVIEAARLRRNVISDHPHISPERFHDHRAWVTIPREDFDRLHAALAALDTSSSLAAEGTPRDADPPHKGQQACRCKGPNFCTCDDATCWCNWNPEDPA